MVAAAKALATIADKNPQHLPRYRSNRSGSVFARITAADTLEPFKNSSAPIGQRLPSAIALFQAGNGILKLYSTTGLAKEGSAQEVVELTGMVLRTSVVLLALVNEFVPTLKTDDPTYLTRMAGLERMRQGMATTVAGTLQMLADRRSFRADELRRLVEHMQESLPAIFVELAPGPRADLVAGLEKMSRDSALRDLHPGLGRLYDRVRAAADKAPSQLAGVRVEDLQKKGITMHRLQAGAPDPSGWSLADSTGGGYSVMLPGRFNDFAQSATAQDGVAMSLHIVGTTTLVGAKFSAMLVSRADGKNYAEGADGLVERWRAEGKRVEKRMVQIAGYPGTEVVVSGTDTAAVFRMVYTGDKVYQMIVEYPVGLKDAIGRDVDRFFASFAIHGKAIK